MENFTFDLQRHAGPSSDNLMLGAGQLYFDRFDANGASTGARHLGNSTAFTLTTTVEKVDKYSAMDKAKRLYKSAIKSIKATGKITLDEFDPSNMALALLGTEGVLSQTAGTVTSVSPFAAVAKKGYLIKLPNFNVSEVVVKNTGDLVTYVEGTDYIVQNAFAGTLYIPATSNIADAAAIRISFTYGTAAYPKISGATSGTITGMLRFVGDPSSGPAYLGEFWKINVSPSGDLGFIGDDFANFTLDFECMDDSVNHPNDPMNRVIRLS